MADSAAQARWYWFIPCCLLLAVACRQLWLSHTADLTPWSGGGFGMFSVIDSATNRHLHVFTQGDGIRRERGIPEALSEKEKRLLTLPSEPRLRAFAADFLALPGPGRETVETIELQVWTSDFDHTTLEPSGRILRGVSFRVDEL